jgi:hypothetical protein
LTPEVREPVEFLTSLLGHRYCGSFEVPQTGEASVYNPTNRLEVSRRAHVDRGEIVRLCFVVEDLESAREHFRALGVREKLEIHLPEIAHEIEFDPDDTLGIPIQLGCWGSQIEATISDGLDRGAVEFRAPDVLPIPLADNQFDRVHCVVTDLQRVAARLGELLCTDFAAPFEVPEWGIQAAGSPLGVVLVEPTSPSSVLGDEIAKRGSQHISRVGFRTLDLDAAVAHFASLGVSIDRHLERPGLRIAHFASEDTHGFGFQIREVAASSAVLPEGAL